MPAYENIRKISIIYGQNLGKYIPSAAENMKKEKEAKGLELI